MGCAVDAAQEYRLRNASYFIAICASMHQSVLSSMVLVFRGVFGVLCVLVDYCAVFPATHLP